ncbi:MAG: hypothetical protein ACI89J_001120 [Hyphomicrobiaceae bacterium]|jgi:hypothetical protein
MNPWIGEHTLKAIRDQIGRLHIIAVLAAVSSIFSLIAATSATNGFLTTAMRGHDGRLQAMSERAERIQMFARHIRKASLTSSEPDVDLPFGGFVGAASRIEPGARLKLMRPGNGHHTLEVLSVNKVPSAFGLAASEAQSVELLIITGRALWAPGEPVMRILVTATSDKPVTSSIIDQRTL